MFCRVRHLTVIFKLINEMGFFEIVEKYINDEGCRFHASGSQARKEEAGRVVMVMVEMLVFFLQKPLRDCDI